MKMNEHKSTSLGFMVFSGAWESDQLRLIQRRSFLSVTRVIYYRLLLTVLIIVKKREIAVS